MSQNPSPQFDETTQIFLRARNLLAKRGWIRGAFTDSQGRICLGAAVWSAANGYYSAPFWADQSWPFDWPFDLKLEEAGRRLIAALGLRTSSRTIENWSIIVKWNDDKKTVKEDVLALLDRAAGVVAIPAEVSA